MQRVILDVKPISEFRAKAASLVQQVRRTKRPVVITQQGRGAAVLGLDTNRPPRETETTPRRG